MIQLYPIIDTHCHIYPEKIAEKAVASIGEFYGIHMETDGTLDALFEKGKEAGVTHYLVHSVATSPKQVSSINKFLAECQNRYPDELTAFGTLHPFAENVEYDIKELISLNLKGVKLHPDFQKFNIDCDEAMSLYALVQGKLPVLFHTGDFRQDYSHPRRLRDVAKKFPNLKIIAAHFGFWSRWIEGAKYLEDCPNVVVDCSSSFYSLSNKEIINLINSFGSNRVLFGSDFPMWNPKVELERLLSLGLKEEDLQNILYKNACRLLNVYSVCL